MTPQIISSPAAVAMYLLEDYREAAREQFPHHGGTLLQSERAAIPSIGGRVYYNRVRDFVCPDCDKAWSAWWAAYKAEHAPAD